MTTHRKRKEEKSDDEVLEALRKTREAMSLLQRELDEIEIEILRRQAGT